MRRGALRRSKSRSRPWFLVACGALAAVNAFAACGDSPGAEPTDAGADAIRDASTDGDATVDASIETGASDVRVPDPDSPTDSTSERAPSDAPTDSPRDAGSPPPFDGGSVWQATPVGSPRWLPADPHLFSAPIGTITCNGAGRVVDDTVAAPNHRWFASQTAVGPGRVHAAPYDRELGPLIAAHGFIEKTVFSAREFTPAAGIYFIFSVIPSSNAPTGSSPDFVSGPILPNALFPLVTTGMLYRNGVVWDPNNGGAYPAQTVFVSGIDGASHVPFFFNDNMSWAPRPAPPVDGTYEWRVTVRDSNGDGWDVKIPYVVESPIVFDAGADGGCFDTQNDPENCGACGRSCHGGKCDLGTCQPFALAQDLSSLETFALDSTNAYFCSHGSSTSFLSKLSLAGGAPTTLRSDLAFTCTGFGVGPSDLYWLDSTGLLIMSSPIAGGSATQLGSALNVDQIIVDGADLFWTSSAVWRMPVTGGASTRVDMNAGVHGIAVDATNVYWIRNGASLEKAPRAGGGATTTVQAGLAVSEWFALDATSAYAFGWDQQTSSTVVYKFPLGGGAPNVLATVAGSSLGSWPVLDGQNIYFTLARQEGTNVCHDVVSVPLGGGPVKTYAVDQPNLPNRALGVDATYVYWMPMGNPATGYNDGAVLRVPK